MCALKLIFLSLNILVFLIQANSVVPLGFESWLFSFLFFNDENKVCFFSRQQAEWLYRESALLNSAHLEMFSCLSHFGFGLSEPFMVSQSRGGGLFISHPRPTPAMLHSSFLDLLGSESAFCVLYKFWEESKNKRIWGLMEGLENRWNGKEKEAFLKTSFQKTLVTASSSFFQTFLGHGVFHKGPDPPFHPHRVCCSWVVWD